jgi:hypothetical protein
VVAFTFGPSIALCRTNLAITAEEVVTGKKERQPSTYEVLRAHGIDRRDFLKFCTATAAAMGLEATMVPRVVAAMETCSIRNPTLAASGTTCWDG